MTYKEDTNFKKFLYMILARQKCQHVLRVQALDAAKFSMDKFIC